MGFETGDLIMYLDYDNVQQFMKPKFATDVPREEWENDRTDPSAHEEILAAMKNYMEFAWGKAENCRGISASRSISHFKAWLWILEDDETLAFAEDEGNYASYGVPILTRICEKYQIKIPGGPVLKAMQNGRCNDEFQADAIRASTDD